MSLFGKTISLIAVLTLCSHLVAAPRSGTAKAGEEQESPKAATSQSTSAPPMALTRRIITKVDGVIVDERDAAPVDAPLLPPVEQIPDEIYRPHGRESDSDTFSPHPTPSPRAPEGVTYEGMSVPLPDEGAPTQSETPPVEPEPSETAEEGSGFFGSMFGNFLSPERDAASNRMRSGKGRAQHLAPEGESGPAYLTAPIPEAPKESPFIAPSHNLIVGEVVSVDTTQGIVVAWMQSRFIALERNVITRNHELETTGVLRPTAYRNGRAYGFDLAVGEPSVGDEVVLTDAGPAIRQQDELSVNVSISVEPSAQN